MLFIKQNASITIKIGPMLDSINGNDQETALTIAQGDVVLSKNGGAFAQKNDATSCTHDAKGMYGCPLNATDTGTAGKLQLLVHMAGALAVWHDFMVLPANVYDSLVAGTDYLDVAVVDQANIDFGALQKTSLNAATPASVTGAVGSVTGNVSGNVGGSVASVTGAVGSVTAGVTVAWNNDKMGYGLSAAAIQAIWDALTSAFTTVGSIGKKLADWVVGTIDTYTGNTKQTGDTYARLGAPAGVSVSADVAAIKAQTAAIETDTQDLQAQVGVDGAGLTALGDTRIANLDAGVTTRAAAAICTEARLAELDAANVPADIDTLKTRIPSTVGFTGANVNAQVKAIDDIDLSATQKASVNAQVADVIKTDTVSEMAQGAPPVSPSVEQILNYLYRRLRNKVTDDGSNVKVYNDAKDTVLIKAPVSDDGSTFTKDEYVSGA